MMKKKLFSNHLTKELAYKVIWEEEIKIPSIQKTELNPKEFRTGENF